MDNPFPEPTPPDKEHLNNLVYWYPILKEIRMRVPKTIIVHRGDCELIHILDGKEPDGWTQFHKRLIDAMEEMGLP